MGRYCLSSLVLVGLVEDIKAGGDQVGRELGGKLEAAVAPRFGTGRDD
jgi:hypothetical protein